MPYALDRALFVENGPAIQSAEAAAKRHGARLLPWRKLNDQHRLEAVERILSAPANDLVDGYPLAL